MLAWDSFQIFIKVYISQPTAVIWLKKAFMNSFWTESPLETLILLTYICKYRPSLVNLNSWSWNHSFMRCGSQWLGDVLPSSGRCESFCGLNLQDANIKEFKKNLTRSLFCFDYFLKWGKHWKFLSSRN